MNYDYRNILLDHIDIPAERVRSIKADRVEVLAADIRANGLLQPIGVVEEETGRFTLVFGLHRLSATKMLGLFEIDARVQPHNWIKPQQRRVDEIMENLNREGLTMLERAESLAALKVLHEELYPETKNGGDARAKRAKKATRGQNEIFSFRHEAAEKIGLSRRAIEIAVAIAAKLDPSVKTRLRGTWVEDHQAGLRSLSELAGDMQHKVCDLLFSTPPQASNVAEAKLLAEGSKLPTADDRAFASAHNSVARLSERQRHALFDQYEAAVRAYAQEKGWL